MTIRDEIPDFERYRGSLEYLLAASNEERFQSVFPMGSGDLILVDNDRFAHGRKSIVGERQGPDGPEINPRQLWSVTVA